MDNEFDIFENEDFEYENEDNELTILSDKENERIDVYVSGMLEDMSRSSVQKLIADGNVTVNDKIIKSNYKIRLNDSIRIILPEPEVLDVAAENIPIDIVYEDDDLAVINKAQAWLFTRLPVIIPEPW